VYSLKDGPFIGYVFGKDVEQRGVAFGYQVTYEQSPLFSVELAGSWHEDESVSVGDRLPGIPGAGAIDLDVVAFALTGRFDLRPDRAISPYVGGGFGYTVLKVDNEQVRIAGAEQSLHFIEADADQGFGAHLVLGIEATLAPRWELFAEWREVFFDTDIKVTVNPHPAGGPATARDNLDYDYRMIRLGVNYRF
jgi:opacity protein-like surface antigen